jgi:hypothetical protein
MRSDPDITGPLKRIRTFWMVRIQVRYLGETD